MTDGDVFAAAARVEPELGGLERFVAKQFLGDLPSVENWVARFTRIMNRRPELQTHRKAIFRHLLECHNVAVAMHARAEVAP